MLVWMSMSGGRSGVCCFKASINCDRRFRGGSSSDDEEVPVVVVSDISQSGRMGRSQGMLSGAERLSEGISGTSRRTALFAE